MCSLWTGWSTCCQCSTFASSSWSHAGNILNFCNVIFFLRNGKKSETKYRRLFVGKLLIMVENGVMAMLLCQIIPKQVEVICQTSLSSHQFFMTGLWILIHLISWIWLIENFLIGITIKSVPVFFVASRGHHADVGGITPGNLFLF